MIDWVSIVRHSRHRISSYVSPRRRTEQPSDRYTVCTDSIPLPHHVAKSKVNRIKQQEQEQQQQQQQLQQKQSQHVLLYQPEEKQLFIELPSPRLTTTKVSR
uniref:Putative thyroid hormone receptor-associated protein complex subunit n=1 Tax=Anopheles triannulatus TaxID=58253 RepID=A0A2M4B053_9DIPT